MKRSFSLSFVLIAFINLLSFPSEPVTGMFSLMFCEYKGDQIEERTKQYFDELKTCGVTIDIPKGFHPIDLNGIYFLKKNISDKWMSDGEAIQYNIAAALENDDRDVSFLFPMVSLLIPELKCDDVIAEELRNNAYDMSLDILPLIKIIDGKKQKNDADTIIIYNYDFKKPFLDRYNHCVGVYLSKATYPALLLRIALTDKSFADREKYIRLLVDNINYVENPDSE